MEFQMDYHRSYWFWKLDNEMTALVDQKNNSVEYFINCDFNPFKELIKNSQIIEFKGIILKNEDPFSAYFKESIYGFDNSIITMNSDWNEQINAKYKCSFLFKILKILLKDGNNLTLIDFKKYKDLNLSQLKDIVEYLKNLYNGSNKDLLRIRKSERRESNEEYI